MAQIKSLDELKAIRDRLKDNIDIRHSGEAESNIKLLVGMATCGIAAGARDTFKALFEEIKNKGLANITLIQSGCMGACHSEPTVEVRIPEQEPILYGHVTPDKAVLIIQKHIMEGELVQNLIIGKPFETV